MDSSNLQPPIRRSLSNDDLEARVNQAMTSHSGVEAVMELLVAQEALRAQEDQEEAIWVANMQAIDSAESLAALERFRSTKPGYVAQEVPPVTPIPAPVVEVQPEPVFEVQQEPVVEVHSEPEPISQPQTFTWLNPAPSAPVVVEPVVEVPEVVEPVVERAVEPEQTAFSWFTQPEPEVQQDEPVELQETVVVEESTIIELEPVGSESETEFEKLLAAAAAEEELTALEELESKTGSTLTATETNVLIPSDEHRDRGPLSQLWIWLGLSATLVPVLLVWALIGLGLNATAVTVALSVGYLCSGTLIAVAAIAGKRSGLSTATISRSAFGVWGNSIPLTVVFAARILVTAIIIATFTFLTNGIDSRLPSFQSSLVNVMGINLSVGLAVQAVVLVLVSVLVFVRGNFSRIMQVLFSLLSFGLFAESFIVIPSGGVSFLAAGTIGVASLEAIDGVALVIMVNLTIWFAIAPNLSKAIPMRVRGIKVFSAVMVSNFVMPAAVGVLALLWLGPLSSGPGLSTIQGAVAVLPAWAQGAMLSGIGIALVYAATLSLRTATLDLVSLFRLKSRVPSLVIAFFATIGILLLFAQQPTSVEVSYLANMFVIAASLTAGWIGIFAADVSIRRQAYHELSLSRSYGVYKKFNILSLIIWMFSLAAAVALIPVNLIGFDFMGFALPLLGFEANIASAALGFAATVLLSMLFTFAIRIPQIKKQEREVLALEARREQLNDIFVGTE